MKLGEANKITSTGPIQFLPLITSPDIAPTTTANITISGTVVNEVGEPVENPNVVESGTTNGTMGDFDGNFTLRNVRPDAIIDFTYQGILTKLPVKEASGTVTIKTVGALDEVVIIAPGDKPKNKNSWMYAAGIGLLGLLLLASSDDDKKPKKQLGRPRGTRNRKPKKVKL